MSEIILHSGAFVDRDDNAYKITFYKTDDASLEDTTDDLVFSGEIPVVINRNGGVDDIFAPIRSSSADINLVSAELLTDLYTANKDEVKVRIEKQLYEIEEETIHHDAWTKQVIDTPAWDEKIVIPAWDEEIVHPAWDEGGWIDKEWNKEITFGEFVWKDNDGHVYYSNYASQFELVNGQWVNKTWDMSSFVGSRVWKDSEGHIYCSDFRRQYELVNGQWVNKTWNILLNFGEYIWSDNDGHVYYSDDDEQYELVNGQWVEKTWNVEIYRGNFIWKDNDGHVYYSFATQSNNYELIDGQWIKKSWNRTISYGNDIWKDNDGHIYYSLGSSGYGNTQYELVNGQWENKTWNEIISFGSDIWLDNDGHIYYSDEDIQYELTPIIHHDEWIEIIHHPEEVEIVHHPATYRTETIHPAWDQIVKTKVPVQRQITVKQWEDKVWNKNIEGHFIWTDGAGHVYFSYEDANYELVNGQWVDKVWNKDIRYGHRVWKSDENEIYYTYNYITYKLVNGQWVDKDWNREISDGRNIWHGNGHTYYMNYELDPQTEVMGVAFYVYNSGSWDPMPNEGESHGNQVWTDNSGHIYYTNAGSSSEFVNGQWVEKTWNVDNLYYGSDIWKDGYHIYYSAAGNQYELVDGLWVDKEWNKEIRNGEDVWYDSEGNIYYSDPYNQSQYIEDWVDKTWNKDIWGHYIWKDNDGHIYYSNEDIQYELVNGQWVDKEWNKEITYGYCVWKDNDGHIYYSGDEEFLFDDYELVNGQWVNKTWNKVVFGVCVWKDNDGHIYTNFRDEEWGYYSYELVNGQWVDKTWNKDIWGDCVWKDNDGHVYYSDEDIQYELVNGQWVDKEWNKEITYGKYVWKDNNGHIYYSGLYESLSNDYELVNGQWVNKTWNKVVCGVYIWQDNDGHIYHSAKGEGGSLYSSELVTGYVQAELITTYAPAPNELIWEGYMTPNVYSQEVTQNLDEISMTCIDPVSLLKYVKIDKIMSRPAVVTYRDLLGKALAYVKLDSNTLLVEDCVDYQDSNYDNILDFHLQVSNFWDEGGEPSTLYDMIGEMLRPFGLCLIFTGKEYKIYDVTKSSAVSDRYFKVYLISNDGTLVDSNEVRNEGIKTYRFGDDEWISNNISPASVEIGPTYDKVTGVASTSIPTYSQSAFDLISPDDRDKYDAGWLNVQKNVVKGTGFPDDRWEYIWNGVYVNDDYELKLFEYQGSQKVPVPVNGFVNINNAYEYLTGNEGTPEAQGSILNFYGGANNPTGTGKEQTVEKAVEVKKRITAFAPENGCVPEYFDRGNCTWNYDERWNDETMTDDPQITWTGGSSVYTGEVRDEIEQRVVYRSSYPNMTLFADSPQTIDINITRSYSRTGIDHLIDMMETSAVENRRFRVLPPLSAEDTDWWCRLSDGDLYYFPWTWNSKNVKFDWRYMNRYEAGSTQGLLPIWDKTRVDAYIRLNDGTVYQFNGKDWIQDTEVKEENAFYLVQMMNDKKAFHEDYKYDLIECADGQTYSLTEESFVWRTNNSGAVVPSGGSAHHYEVYYSTENDWIRYIEKCDEGSISIIMPELSGVNVTVNVDIWNSNLLGITGADRTMTAGQAAYTINFPMSGTGWRIDPETGQMEEHDLSYWDLNHGTGSYMCSGVGNMPMNVSYFKAEHLDIDIEVSVPESNLGQMFGESDIKYTIEENKGCMEDYEGPTFMVNTAHNLVKNSFSYLIYDDQLADAESFIINGVGARPECYVVQAYMNYLSRIRKIYKKTLVPVNIEGQQFDNENTFIESPEIQRLAGQDNWLYVVADSWDLQTNRHTVEAVEDYDMDVDDINSYSIVEIPRNARNHLFNLPSVRKK